VTAGPISRTNYILMRSTPFGCSSHLQVLLQTRSASSRTRCLALEVVVHMLDRLREEYLVLLPEVRGDGISRRLGPNDYKSITSAISAREPGFWLWVVKS